MKFTDTHVIVLERHREHWGTLKKAGYMKNLDRSVFDELVKVYHEAIANVSFTHWCGACVAGMVRGLYTAYERWQEAGSTAPSTDVTPTGGLGKRWPFQKHKGGNG